MVNQACHLQEMLSLESLFKIQHQCKWRFYSTSPVSSRRSAMKDRLAYSVHVARQIETTLFSYQSLEPNQFRLLTLYPKAQSAELFSCLTNVERTTLFRQYTALSYTWGESQKTHSIKCGIGRSTEISATEERGPSIAWYYPLKFPHHIYITENLHAALLCIQDEVEFQELWIDAVCINQDDILEKNKQVQSMTSIYFGAHKVLAWLGKEDQDTAAAFKTMDDLYALKDCPIKQEDTDACSELFGYRPWLLSKSDEAYISNEGIKAFWNLMKRPWFHRAWIFQEIVISKRASIQCGSHNRDWQILYGACSAIENQAIHQMDDLHRVVRVLGETREKVYTTIPRLKESEEQLSEYAGTVHLKRLLLEQRFRQASDPRDKVFSLVALTFFTCS